jgi:hypothetical protein
VKILNFSCVEILPALLGRSKTQTIRPAWKVKDLGEDKDMPFGIRLEGTYEKPARFKVGEKIQIAWKSRGTPKGQIFCWHHGNPFKSVIGSGQDLGIAKPCGCIMSSMLMKAILDKSANGLYQGLTFPKVLGTAEIVEVFKIKLGKTEGELPWYSNYDSALLEQIAKKDGFEDAEEMFKWFDEHYNLSSPKEFWVYRWKWREE